MYRQVKTNIILKSEMEGILQASWAAHNGLAGALPVREVQIYRAGYLAALQAVGLAVGVDWEDRQADNRAAALPLRIDDRF